MKKINYKLKLLKRSLQFFFQRMYRGFDDSELWGLDGSLARLILPRLKRFQQSYGGHPAQLTDEEWGEILHQMVDAFEFYASERRFDCSPKEYDKAQLGLDLFAKWYGNLWW